MWTTKELLQVFCFSIWRWLFDCADLQRAWWLHTNTISLYGYCSELLLPSLFECRSFFLLICWIGGCTKRMSLVLSPFSSPFLMLANSAVLSMYWSSLFPLISFWSAYTALKILNYGTPSLHKMHAHVAVFTCRDCLKAVIPCLQNCQRWTANIAVNCYHLSLDYQPTTVIVLVCFA